MAVLLIALAHWPLLLNDGVYWDGWIIHTLARTGNVSELMRMFNEQRNGGLGLIHVVAGRIGDGIFVYKLATFTCLLVNGALARVIGLRCGLSAVEALFLAAFAGVFTAYQVHVELIMLPYALGLTAFLAASALALSDGGSHVSPARLALAALLFALSFQIASFIAFYVGLLALWLLVACRTGLGLRALLGRAMLWRAIALAVVPLPALANHLLSAPYGVYADYNRVEARDGALARSARAFADASVWQQFRLQFAEAAAHPVAAAVAVSLCLVALLLAGRARGGHQAKRDEPRREAAAILLIAILFAALAILPYAAVDKQPEASGWETRHALLAALPLGLFLVAAGRLLPQGLPRIVPAALLLGVSVLATWSIYLRWEIAWIRDASLMRHLATDLGGELEANDQLVIREGPGGSMRNFYEYQGMLAEATGRQRWFAVNDAQAMTAEQIFRRLPPTRYLARDYDGQGCALRLGLDFTVPKHIEFRVVARYTLLRLFRQDALGPFLSSLSTVSAESLSDRRVADLKVIRNALEAYRAANGSYPPAPGGRTVLDVPVGGRVDWIGGLSPRFIAETPAEPRWRNQRKRQYLYISDGEDYKIVSHASEDAACVTRRDPGLADPRRPGYAFGFWSPGAVNR